MTKLVQDHFRKADKRIHSIYIPLGDIAVIPKNTYFTHLTDAIISQQLSVKAGATIFKRFESLFPKGKITPEALLQLKDEQIREVGASWSKVKYLKNLAEKVVSKELKLETLVDMDDEAVIEALVQVKGIGRWTAEMFLIFALGRPDIFSYGDLGLRRALQKVYNMKSEPTLAQMEKIVKKWSPHKSYASRLLWKSLDNEG